MNEVDVDGWTMFDMGDSEIVFMNDLWSDARVRVERRRYREYVTEVVVEDGGEYLSRIVGRHSAFNRGLRYAKGFMKRFSTPDRLLDVVRNCSACFSEGVSGMGGVFV